MAENKREHPPILYYQLKDKHIYWIYEYEQKHWLVEVKRVPFEEGLIQFLKVSGGKSLSTVIDIHDFNDHLNIKYKSKLRKRL